MTIPAWSEALPKLYDLYSCSDRTDPNNYFNAPNVMQALDDCDSGLKEIESDLQPIDGEAWKEFKFKTVPYVTATDRWGWNTQLFDRFNEVKGYVFLKQQGYLDIYFIAEVSLRQSLVPANLLGRTNATLQFLSQGVAPLGALLAGILGGMIGLRLTIFIGVLGVMLAGTWLLLSPVRKV